MTELKQIAKWFTDLKPYKRVGIIFAVLLLFVIVAERPGSNAVPKNSTYFLPQLKVEDVSNIVIVNPELDEKQVILSKEDDRWLVANGRSFPADEMVVNDFLKELYQLSEVELVSNNPERLERFKVDTDQGIEVRLWDGDTREIAHFYAGSSRLDQQYFRKADSDSVISGDQNLLPFLGLNKDRWKDRLLMTVEEQDVKRIALLDSDQEVIIEHQLEDWFVISPEAYQPDLFAIRTLFEQLKKIEGTRFADSLQQSQANFDEPDYRLSVRLNDDSLKTLNIVYLADADLHIAQNNEREVAYVVATELVEQLFDISLKNGTY